VREALGESSDKSRYIETVALRGYRFLAEVERIGEAAAVVAKAGPADPGKKDRAVPLQILSAMAYWASASWYSAQTRIPVIPTEIILQRIASDRQAAWLRPFQLLRIQA